MSEKPNKELEFQEAKILFESLQLSDWRIDDGYKKSGGQASVLAVNDTNRRKGVFRLSKKKDETSIKRFHHELGILIDPKFKHKNIVNILEYTKDEKHQWYISERGENFTLFWEHQKEKYSENPEGLVKSAVEILKQICDGLKFLHMNGIVHRDVKPDNIIVVSKDSQKHPVLIDFGISYSDFVEERITDVADAVGNARFSPDVMMNWLREPLPWLDIFQLSQVLIWMVQISPVKNTWTRPLDWRWVNYDDKLSERTILSLRAVTAQCSEHTISPQNAGELFILFEQLFPIQTPIQNDISSIKIENIKSGIAIGKAKQAIKLAEDLKATEASNVVVKQFYDLLLEQLHLYSERLQQEGFPVTIRTLQNFEEFYEAVIQNPEFGGTLCELCLGDSRPRQFFIRVECKVYLPSTFYRNQPTLPDSSNIFTIHISRWSYINSEVFPFSLNILTFERDGKISLRTERMEFIRNVNISETVNFIKELSEDSIAWEIIQLDRYN